MLIDPQRVTEIIRETTKLDILPRFRNLSDSEIMEKSPGDIVTVADYEAEKRLTSRLSDMHPSANILAEEAVSKIGCNLDNYCSMEDTWLIDPVDGTRNFSKGIPIFAVVVAFVRKSVTELAWIHLPMENATFFAERGNGAFIIDGPRLTAANEVDLDTMKGLLNLRAFDDKIPPEKIKNRSSIFYELKNFRCAGFDFVELARGNKHFSLYRRLWPWDHAAGTLIFQEAGGYVARIDGSDYNPLSRIWGLLCAPNFDSWKKIYTQLTTSNLTFLKGNINGEYWIHWFRGHGVSNGWPFKEGWS